MPACGPVVPGSRVAVAQPPAVTVAARMDAPAKASGNADSRRIMTSLRIAGGRPVDSSTPEGADRFPFVSPAAPPQRIGRARAGVLAAVDDELAVDDHRSRSRPG